MGSFPIMRNNLERCSFGTELEFLGHLHSLWRQCDFLNLRLAQKIKDNDGYIAMPKLTEKCRVSPETGGRISDEKNPNQIHGKRGRNFKLALNLGVRWHSKLRGEQERRPGAVEMYGEFVEGFM